MEDSRKRRDVDTRDGRRSEGGKARRNSRFLTTTKRFSYRFLYRSLVTQTHYGFATQSTETRETHQSPRIYRILPAVISPFDATLFLTQQNSSLDITTLTYICRGSNLHRY